MKDPLAQMKKRERKKENNKQTKVRAGGLSCLLDSSKIHQGSLSEEDKSTK